jgi:hypothetical protein
LNGLGERLLPLTRIEPFPRVGDVKFLRRAADVEPIRNPFVLQLAAQPEQTFPLSGRKLNTNRLRLRLMSLK